MTVLNALKGLVVVLPVIVSTVGMLMASGATYNLFVQKSCCPGGPPDNINVFICDNKTIISNVNEIQSVGAIVKTVCSAVFGASLGFLRDLTGKSKLLMYVGVIGELVSVCSLLGTTLYWDSTAWIPGIVQSIASGGLGDNIMQMGATCILIHQSTPEELPLRLQFYMLSTLAMALCGGLLSTVVLTNLGYQWLFIICIGFQVTSLIIIIIVNGSDTGKKNFEESMVVLKSIFKWRDNSLILWLMLIITPISTAVMTTESMNAATFYQQKFRFTMYKSAMFGTYSFVIGIIGSMAGPVIMRKVFHFRELTIGVVCSICNSVAALSFAFVDLEGLLYVCSILYVMKLAALPIPGTIISSIVGNDELGTYFGIAAVVTALLPMGITGLYRQVFSQTQDSWIGAFYLVSCGCFLIQAAIFGVSYCIYTDPEKPEIIESKEDLGQNIENGSSDLSKENSDL